MCYLAEHGRSALKGIGINRRKLPTLGNAALTARNTPLPHCVALSNVGASIDRGEPQKLGNVGNRSFATGRG